MAESITADDTLLRIQQHDKYFCRALEMVPRHLTTEVNVEEQLNTRYFKHRKVPLTSEERKARSKAAKKERYDPAGMKVSDEPGEEKAAPAAEAVGDAEDQTQTHASSLDMLREKLRKKIEQFSSRRGDKQMNDKKRKLSKDDNEQERRNRAKDLHGKHRKIEDASGATSDGEADESAQRKLTTQPPPLSLVEEGDFVFSGVTDGNGISHTPGKPGSKMRRLKSMLKQAEAKQHRLDKLRQTNQELLTEVQFEDAMHNAVGAKTFDDPKKLRKAIKRREKTKEKSTKTWQARLDDAKEQKEQRQLKRMDNIAKRKQPIATPIATPATPRAAEGASAKADKSKKPRRAGFEGKKTDFLNSQK